MGKISYWRLLAVSMGMSLILACQPMANAADQKVSDMTEKTAPVYDDWMYVLDSEASNADRKAKVGHLREMGDVRLQDYYADLSAIAAEGSDVTVVIYKSIAVPGGGVTIPSNVSFVIHFPGQFTSTSNGLVINGSIQAGLYKIFDGSGVTVKQGYVEAAWFGFDTAETAANNRTALAAAVAAWVSPALRVNIHAGNFSVDTTAGSINLDNNRIELIGAGADSTDITVSGSNDFLVLNSSGTADGSNTLRRIKVRGIYAHHSAAGTARGVYVKDVTNGLLENVKLDDFNQGLDLNTKNNFYVKDIACQGNVIGIRLPDWYTTHTPQQIYFEDVLLQDNSSWGLVIDSDWGDLAFRNVVINPGSTDGQGIKISTGVSYASGRLLIDGLALESFDGAGNNRGIHVNDVNTLQANHITIVNANFNSSGMEGIRLENCRHVTIINSQFGTTAAGGGLAYHLNSSTSDVHFVGCRFADEDNFTVQGSQCYVTGKKTAVKIYRDTSQNISTGSWQAPNWNTTDFDKLGGEADLGNERITVIHAGIYMAVGQYTLGGLSVGDTFGVRIRHNTAIVAVHQVEVGDAGKHKFVVPTPPLGMSAGDYVELQVYQDSGGSLSSDGGVASEFLSLVRVN